MGPTSYLEGINNNLLSNYDKYVLAIGEVLGVKLLTCACYSTIDITCGMVSLVPHIFCFRLSSIFLYVSAVTLWVNSLSTRGRALVAICFRSGRITALTILWPIHLGDLFASKSVTLYSHITNTRQVHF
jgi:hypothetical protein